MRCIAIKGILFAAAFMVAAAANAQNPKVDLALTLDLEHARVAQSGTSSLWLKGGGLEGAVTFYHGFGVAADLMGDHASDIQGNTDLNKLAFTAGPRYTFDVSRHVGDLLKQHDAFLFAESLFGVTHGFDSVFPSSTGVMQSANSFSMQLGGGVDIGIKDGFGVRPIEVAYRHTSFPNNAANSQNDFSLAFAAVYRR